jgi:hypothetical protein
VTYSEIWPTVWGSVQFIDKWADISLVERATSQGVQNAVDIYNQVMEKTEKVIEQVIRDYLVRTKRSPEGWKAIYDKTILDGRREVVNRLDAAIKKASRSWRAHERLEPRKRRRRFPAELPGGLRRPSGSGRSDRPRTDAGRCVSAQVENRGAFGEAAAERALGRSPERGGLQGRQRPGRFYRFD